MLFFEDFEVGDVIELATVSVDETAIVEFARKYDPQPMHLDPAAAAESHFGGLIASGWHTCALSMRVLADWFQQAEVQGMGSPGLKSVRWLAPVRPGDVLTFPQARLIRGVRVVDLGSRRGPAAEAQGLYEDLEPAPAKTDPPKPARVDREPGTGRPTKAQRRATDRLRDRH